MNLLWEKEIIRDEEKGEAKYEPDNHDEGFFLTGGHSSSAEGCLINFFNEYGAHTNVLKKIKDEYKYNKESITGKYLTGELKIEMPSKRRKARQGKANSKRIAVTTSAWA